MKTYVFPGQGSQAVGMGAGLFERFPEIVAAADDVLGWSIASLCTEDPRNELNRTEFTQPALYVVNALSWMVRQQAGESPPDFLAGHSLGEYNALLAAGCFDFETGLRLVKRRGELMAGVSGGAMAAITNAQPEQVAEILRGAGLDAIDLANFNTPTQVVLSGLKEDIIRAEKLFTERRLRFYPLNTSGAFHSRYMRPVAAKFSEFLAGFALSDPRTPVISNVTARPHESGRIAENLAAQLASSVRWSDSVHFLIDHAAASGESMEFVELGHGDALTRMILTIRQLRSDTPRAPTVDAQTVGRADEDGGQAAGKPPRDVVDAQDAVAAWNARWPVGAVVRCKSDGETLETRTAAHVLFGHRAAVYLKGYDGYFSLDDLQPLTADAETKR
jgi:malonyl CoA-acyl carrier protein transacylase